ncbi:MAG: hypothetical protein U9N56_00475 [Actinomycetota bacterium]|nr:hypothetical protein [Actinomycetota bacterium]
MKARHMSRSLRWVVIAVALMVVLSACAAGANPTVDTPSADGNVAGFWLGLWQGIIVPIAFIVSLFSDTVSIYEVHNNGGWYDFGFVIGAGFFLGGGGAGARGATRR